MSNGTRRKSLLAILLVAMFLTGSLGTLSAEGEAPKKLDVVNFQLCAKFDNVTVNVVGDAVRDLAPYQFWSDEFAQMGIKINPIEVPVDGVYEKEKTEFA